MNGVRIITYHLISKFEKKDEPFPLTVSLDRFREQLKSLQESKIKLIGLARALEILGKNHIKEPYLVITFDDFYSETIEYAVPLLEEFHYPACFFVPTAYLDSKEPFPWLKKRELYPIPGTRKMLEELSKLGFEIGSHTHTHPRLSGLSPEKVRYELLTSKEILEEITGREVEFLAYPFSDYNEEIKRMVKETGYKCALTTNDGTNKDLKSPYGLFRTYVYQSDNSRSFLSKLRGKKIWLMRK